MHNHLNTRSIVQNFRCPRVNLQHPSRKSHDRSNFIQKLISKIESSLKFQYLNSMISKIHSYITNLGGLSILIYFTISWSGSMLAQAYLSLPKSGPKITIDRPTALTYPSNGKFESEKTFLFPPISIGPKRADKSPT